MLSSCSRVGLPLFCVEPGSVVCAPPRILSEIGDVGENASSSSRSGVSDRPSESEKLFSRGMVDTQEDLAGAKE